MEDLIVLCGASAVIGLLPAAIANSKGHGFFEWWFFGAALFIIALPAAILIKRNDQELVQRDLRDGQHKRCPYCAEIVRVEAVVCKHCGRDIPLAVFQGDQDLTARYLSVAVELQDGHLSLTRTHLRYKADDYHLLAIHDVSVATSPGGYHVIRITDNSGKARDFGFWKDPNEAIRWMQGIKHNQQAIADLQRDKQSLLGEATQGEIQTAP